MPPPRRALGLWAASAVGLVALVVVAYPARASTPAMNAYGALERSPVPVEVVGWIQPSDASAQVLPTGYVLTVQASGVGEVTIAGNDHASVLPPGGVRWEDSGTAYALQTTVDPGPISARVTSLEAAEYQLNGPTLDTPLLYLVYLPALGAFAGWAAVSLLRQS